MRQIKNKSPAKNSGYFFAWNFFKKFFIKKKKKLKNLKKNRLVTTNNILNEILNVKIECKN